MKSALRSHWAANRKTVGRCLERLCERGFIEVYGSPKGSGIIIRLCGQKLTGAYLRFGNDPDYSAELTLTGGEMKKLEYQWTETEVGRRAVNRDHRELVPKQRDGMFARSGIEGLDRSPWSGYDDTRAFTRPVCRGTFVHDLVYIACEKKMGPAMLMSQALWWLSPDKHGNPRAHLVREGRRWVFKSLRKWAVEIGGDSSDISEYIDYLFKTKKFFAKRVWTYMGRKRIHLSPRIAAIKRAFLQAATKADRLAEDRFRDERDRWNEGDEDAAA